MAALERPLPAAAPPSVSVSHDAIPLALRRRGGNPRQVLAMAAIGAIVLALFAAPDLPGWADRLGDGRLAEAIRPFAGDWNRAMAQLGLTRPHEALRNAVQRMQEWRW
jgi:hypothetical protein